MKHALKHEIQQQYIDNIKVTEIKKKKLNSRCFWG